MQHKSKWMVQLLAFCIWLGVAGHSLAVDLKSIIEESNTQFTQAMNTGDVDKVISFFSEEGAVLPPNGEMVTGKHQVRAFWQTVISGGLKATLETDEISSFGDHAYELGFYYLKTPKGEIKDHGKYIVIWVRERNRWKMHRDIFNSSIPVPQSQSAAL